MRNTSLQVRFGGFRGHANGWIAVVVLGAVLIVLIG
jgi:hypothetical protein